MASEELLVTVGLSATKFRNEMKKVNDDLKTAEKNFKTTEKTADLMEKGTENLGTKLKALTKVFEAQNTKIQTYKKRLDELRTSNEKLESNQKSLKSKLNDLSYEYEKSSRLLGENSKEAKSLQKEMNSLVTEIKKNAAALEKGTAEFDRLENALESTQLEADYTKAKMESLQREMSSLESGKAVSELNSLDQALDNAGNEALTLKDRLNSVGDKFKNFGNSMKSVGQNLSATLTLPIVGAGVAMVNVASDAEEMQSKFDTVFKTTAAEVENWAKTVGNSIGRSSLDLKEAVSNSADLMIGMGMTEQKAGELSQKFIELAYDLGSFNNVSDETALEAMTKAMMGETEMAKQLGVNLSVATMEQSEYVKALGKKWKDMTQAEKAEAYYAESVKQSTNAIGDAARTSDSFTNKTRALQGKIKDLSAEIGENLLPIALKLVNKVADIIDSFLKLDERTQNIILTVAAVAAAIGPLLIIVGQMSMGIGALCSAFGAMTALSAPVIAAIAAIIGIIAVLAIGINSGTEEVNAAIDNMSVKFEEAKNICINAMQNLWTVFLSIWETIGKPLYDAICVLTATLVNTFAELFPIIASIFSTVIEILKTVWQTVGKPVFEFIMVIVADVVAFIQEKMPIFVEVIKSAWSMVKNLWDNILKPVLKMIGPVISTMISVITPYWETFKRLISVAFDLVAAIWNGVLKPVFNAIVTVVGGLIKAITPFMQTFMSVITGAMNAVIAPIQWVIDKISDLLGWVKDGVNAVGEFLSSINPFSNLEGPRVEAAVTYNTDGIQALDMQHELYTPRTSLSKSIATVANMKNQVDDQSNSLLKEMLNVMKNNNKEQSNGIIIQIDNFNNNREQDIEQLCKELEFYRRKMAY